MDLIVDIANAGSKILDFFADFVEMIYRAIEGLTMFYNMLEEFDARIVEMIDGCGSTEFSGMPIVEAIATFHYVVGDIIFYLIYLIILFGCLFTIYKIVMLIYAAVRKLIEQISGGISSKGQLTSLLSKVFKR